MKRITSTLLVAAIPALGALSNWRPGTALGDPGARQQTEVQQAGLRQTGNGYGDGTGQGEDQGDGTEADEIPPPDGFDAGNRDGFDVFGRRTKVRGNTFAERIQGGWRLTRMNLSGITSRGMLAQGFMHIGPSFLSMEIHALWGDESESDIPEDDVHSSFTAEYQLDAGGKLFCSTVIGSFMDEDTGELNWERTGFEREYRVREVLNELELTFKDESDSESRLYFSPYLPTTRGQKDIFGRNEIGSFGATDIFGRKKAAVPVDRDIYGRPIDPTSGATGQPGDGTPEKESPLKKLPPKGPGAGGAALGGRGGF